MTRSALVTKVLSDYFRWVALAGVLIIVALGYIFLLSGKIQSIQEEGLARRQQISQEYDRQAKNKAAFEATMRNFKAAFSQADIDNINSFLPTSPDTVALQLDLAEIGKRAGLQLDSISISEVINNSASATSGQVQEVSPTAASQTLTIDGKPIGIQDVAVTYTEGLGYQNFKKFLDYVERSRRLFDILQVSYNHAEDRTSYSATLRTYYIAE